MSKKKRSGKSRKNAKVKLSISITHKKANPCGHAILVKGEGTARFPFPKNFVGKVVKRANKALKAG